MVISVNGLELKHLDTQTAGFKRNNPGQSLLKVPTLVPHQHQTPIKSALKQTSTIGGFRENTEKKVAVT